MSVISCVSHPALLHSWRSSSGVSLQPACGRRETPPPLPPPGLGRPEGPGGPPGPWLMNEEVALNELEGES